MPRTPITTTYSERAEVSTTYNARQWVNYLMTQALDFLMTQDWNYIVLQDSLVNNYSTRPVITTAYS